MKSYALRVIVEPDEDRWHAYCPILEAKGAITWGHTQEEAVRHIREVVQIIVDELLEEGEPIPPGPLEEVQV
jgi:predicted RNase H-like HicB family nuclease